MKRRRGEATVERVLDAALCVYERGGSAGFNVHAIVEESGVSLGSVYHHFGSMDGLAAALYARCMGELLDALIAALAGVRTPRRGVAAIVRAYLEFTARRRACARFIHASAYASFLPAHAPQIAEAKAARIDAIRAFFRPHVQAGAMVALPEHLVEMILIGPVAEVARRWLAGAPEIDLEEAAQLLPERIWRALKRGAPTRRRGDQGAGRSMEE